MIEESLYSNYLNALLTGKRSECRTIVKVLLDGDIDIRQVENNKSTVLLVFSSGFRVVPTGEYGQYAPAETP